MKGLLCTLLVMFAPLRTVDAQAIDPNKLVGRWSGSGTFFNAELQKKVDSVPFVLEIGNDRSGKGRVGEVELSDVLVKPTREYIEVRAKLARPISDDPALAKDRLVIVFTALSDSTAQAEFHLKTNFIYDVRMREGRVLLSRAP